MIRWMISLYKSKKYANSLFFGHIILEKILKAHVVKATKKEAPKIHDLVELAKRAKLDLPQDEIKYLKIVNRFNMRTCYPDIKLRFYKLSTLKYTRENMLKIKKIYKKLCQEIKQRQ